MDREITLIEMLEEASDVLHQIQETGNTDLMNSAIALIAAQCVDERIAELDAVLHKAQRREEMNSNIEYLLKKIDALDIKMTKLENKL